MDLFKAEIRKFIITILFCLISAGVFFFIVGTTRDIEEQNAQYLTEISKQNVLNLSTSISKDLNALNAIANIVGGEKEFSVDRTMEILKMESEHSTLKRMGFLNFEGMATSTDGHEMDLSQRDFFKRAIKGETNISDKLVDIIDEKCINVLSAPVYHKGIIKGAIFATTATDTFSEVLSVESFGGQGFSYVIKADGTCVIYPPNKYNYTEFDNLFDEMKSFNASLEAIEKMQNDLAKGKNGIIEYTRNGVGETAAYTKTDINDWYMISLVPIEIIDGISESLKRSIVIAVIITVTSFYVLIWFNIYANKKNQKELENLAYNDDITGNYNWSKFQIIGRELLNENKDFNYYLIAMDIENFKFYNDVYGFNNGNVLLKQLAEKIADSIGKNGAFARVSADNFAVLLKLDTNIEEFINNLNYSSGSFISDERSTKVKVCLGVYEVNDKTMSIISMYDRATLAKETIKGKRDVSCAMFDETLRDRVLFEKNIEVDMEKALAEEEFIVYYQPKFDPFTEKIKGAEALVRWSHPKKGFVLPGVFIPVFEKNGFIKKLDIYVFEKSCKLIRQLLDNEKTLTPIPISVNLSRVHLKETDFIENLCKISKEYEIPEHYIEIEITESAIIEFADETVLVYIVNQLKENGFLVSMDDFGSGYSSLNMLAELPFDTIKLDRRFFKTKASDKLVRGLIEIIKSMGMQVVAEGIEEKERVEDLKLCGCDLIQGYYFSKPITREELLLKLEKTGEI